MIGLQHQVRPVTGQVDDERCQFCKYPGAADEHPCSMRFKKIVHRAGVFLRACGNHARMAAMCDWQVIGQRKP